MLCILNMKANHKQFQVISLTDEPNGAEQVLLKMALAINGNLIFLKRNNGHGLVIPSHIKTKFLSDRYIFLGLLKLIPIIRKFNRDEIIMSTHPYLNAYLGFFKRIGWLKANLIARECTSVFTRFTGIKKKAYRLIYRIGYPAVDVVVCQTELMKEQLLQYNQFIDEQKILIQANPVDLEKLIENAAQPLPFEENKLQFICAAGRLIPEKGFDVLISAFKIIHQKYPYLKLLILGQGNEIGRLTSLVKQLELEDSVIFKGHILNPMPYFKKAKLCVVSSIKEGFPNTLLEMMALNKAVVSTLCAGGISTIPYITKVAIQNVDLLAQAISNTLEQSDQKGYSDCITYLEQRSTKKFAQSILNAIA
jgi:glycosyltransferase involved in cell wall biosynthesis